MADYRISCVARVPRGDHHHITSAGVVRPGVKARVTSVKKIRKAIKAGTDTFHTVDPTTHQSVPVERFKCCGVKTIRSLADDAKTDNLDALPSCD
ncbi:MAG TPA: DUF3892 domain-containing protein [Acidimicrobiales bacterium]|nr:DUF3892 domain-containing protein [Acidimicrobiales bacterium]